MFNFINYNNQEIIISLLNFYLMYYVQEGNKVLISTQTQNYKNSHDKKKSAIIPSTNQGWWSHMITGHEEN